MSDLCIKLVKYSVLYEEEWDTFVTCNSLNGTFQQTRRFINYHPVDKFVDDSLIFFENENIIAVILACIVYNNNEKIFFSHKGSTFGGIVIGKEYYKIKYVNYILDTLDKYMLEHNYNMCYLKNTSYIFSKYNTFMLDYMLFYRNYNEYKELNFFIDLEKLDSEMVEKNFFKEKRRDLKIANNKGLKFRELELNEIKIYYDILQKNLEKFNMIPVHTLKELLNLKTNILNNIVYFYGVFYEENLIAGSMCFNFNNICFHTQCLALDYKYSNLQTMTFLNYHLIKLSFLEKYKVFSFGISTEENGTKLNYGLANFKESFGIDYAFNSIYYKNYKV